MSSQQQMVKDHVHGFTYGFSSAVSLLIDVATEPGADTEVLLAAVARLQAQRDGAIAEEQARWGDILTRS